VAKTGAPLRLVEFDSHRVSKHVEDISAIYGVVAVDVTPRESTNEVRCKAEASGPMRYHYLSRRRT